MIRPTLIFAVLLTQVIYGTRTGTCGDTKPLDARRLGLQLVIAIEKEKFCSGDADVYTQVFDVTARYRNAGTRKLTVFTGTNFAARVLVASSAEELRAAKYEAELNWDYFPMDGGRYMLGSDPKEERSIILQPGESMVSKSSAGVIVRKSESAKIPGTIASGTHFLQVGMLMKVSEGGAGSQTAQHQGQQPSFTWVSVSSEPIRFEVPVNPALQDCPTKP